MTATDARAPRRQAWAAVLSVAAGTFLMVTTQFLPIGLLSELAQSLHVSNGVAASVVSLPGLIAVFAAPVFAVFAGNIDRRVVTLALTAAIAASSVVTAFAPNFTVLLAGRILLGVSVGGLWSFAIAVGRRLVGEEGAARATAIISAGIAAGTVVGVPAGAIIGDWAGWRAAFAGNAALGFVILSAQFFLLPRLPTHTAVSITSLISVCRIPLVWAGFAAMALIAAGHFTAYTFLQPFLHELAGLDNRAVASALAVYAAAGLAGPFVIERLAATNARASLVIPAMVMAASIPVALLVAQHFYPLFTALILWGVASGAIPVSIQIWMQRAADASYESAAVVLISVFQIGLTTGVALGGVIVDSAGLSTAFLIGGAVVAIGAVLAATLAHAATRSRSDVNGYRREPRHHAMTDSRKVVEKEIDGGDLAVARDNEVSPGVGGRLARRAGHPADPPSVADHFRGSERAIAEVRVLGLDHAGDPMDFVATAIDAIGFVEDGVLVKDLVDRRAAAHGITLPEHVIEIAKQQSRYAGHGFSPFVLAHDRRLGGNQAARWTKLAEAFSLEFL